MQQKRYVAVVEFYIWAESDEQATQQVEALCKEQAKKNDDACQLIKLVEQPFGTVGNRVVAEK